MCILPIMINDTSPFSSLPTLNAVNNEKSAATITAFLTNFLELLDSIQMLRCFRFKPQFVLGFYFLDLYCEIQALYNENQKINMGYYTEIDKKNALKHLYIHSFLQIIFSVLGLLLAISGVILFFISVAVMAAILMLLSYLCLVMQYALSTITAFIQFCKHLKKFTDPSALAGHVDEKIARIQEKWENTTNQAIANTLLADALAYDVEKHTFEQHPFSNDEITENSGFMPFRTALQLFSQKQDCKMLAAQRKARRRQKVVISGIEAVQYFWMTAGLLLGCVGLTVAFFLAPSSLAILTIALLGSAVMCLLFSIILFFLKKICVLMNSTINENSNFTINSEN